MTSSTYPAKVRPIWVAVMTSKRLGISTDHTLLAGGWVYETGVIHEDIDDQIDQAFANVDHILKEAGGKGWDQVFRVNSYHIPLDDRALKAMTRNFDKWMHKHKPLWTCVGVVKLGGGDVMRVEIEVQAYDKGA